jgi:protoheme ferro-lyase
MVHFLFWTLFMLSTALLTPSGGAEASPPRHRVGILLASHGDIDSLSELDSHLKRATIHMAPIPRAIAGPAAAIALPTLRARYVPQYKAFGVATYYRENSQKQARALDEALSRLGLQGKTYVGFNLLSPTVAEAMEAMRAEGSEIIIVINQGAQFSGATRMDYHDVTAYLRKNPRYQPQVIGINQYSEDQRFRDLLLEAVTTDIATYFPGNKRDLCVLMAFHGLPQSDVRRGDRSTQEMIEVFDYVRNQLPEYLFFYGFLNEELIPFVRWTRPTVIDAARDMARQPRPCNKVLFDARISFTVHSRPVLYDLNHLARGEILKMQPDAPIVLAPNFDDDKRFAAFLALRVREALAGKGDLSHLSPASAPAHNH